MGQKLSNGIKEKGCRNPFFIPSHCPENKGPDGVNVDGSDKKRPEKKKRKFRKAKKDKHIEHVGEMETDCSGLPLDSPQCRYKRTKYDYLYKNTKSNKKTKRNFSESSIIAKNNELYLNFGTNRKIENEASKLPIISNTRLFVFNVEN